MYLIYSALNEQTNNDRDDCPPPTEQNERLLRYQAYLETCARYSHYITEVQRYFPGWVPGFR
jgi:hypothetical protein